MIRTQPKSEVQRRRKRTIVSRLIYETYLNFKIRITDLTKQVYRSGILAIVVAMFTFVVICAILVLVVEYKASDAQIKDFGDALWWAVVTVTTTGYGDLVPKTGLGRNTGMLLMFGGMTLIALFSATISSVFVVMRLREGTGLEKIHWTDHIVICGWNQIGGSLMEGLSKFATEKQRIVLVNTLDQETTQNIRDRFLSQKIEFVHGDPTQAETLKRANLAEAATVILLNHDDAGDDQQILTALAARSLSKDARIYAQVQQERSIFHLKHAGVDEVVWVAPYGGYLLASHALKPGIPLVYDELLSVNESSAMLRIPITKQWFGKSYGEFCAQLRKENGAQAIALIRESSVLSVGDILSHDSASIDDFIRRKFEEAGVSGGDLSLERVRINPPDATILADRDVAVALPGQANGGAA